MEGDGSGQAVGCRWWLGWCYGHADYDVVDDDDDDEYDDEYDDEDDDDDDDNATPSTARHLTLPQLPPAACATAAVAATWTEGVVHGDDDDAGGDGGSGGGCGGGDHYDDINDCDHVHESWRCCAMCLERQDGLVRAIKR